MTALVFLIVALAVYRAAEVISSEEGPAMIFVKLRRKVPAKTNAGRGIRCSFCVGMWCAALATAWMWWIGLVPGSLVVIYAFGLSGAAAAIRKATG